MFFSFLSRLSLDDKIYERELELALQMSRSESSQEGKSKSQDEDGESQPEEEASEFNQIDASEEDKENKDSGRKVVQVNEVVESEINSPDQVRVLTGDEG